MPPQWMVVLLQLSFPSSSPPTAATPAVGTGMLVWAHELWGEGRGRQETNPSPDCTLGGHVTLVKGLNLWAAVSSSLQQGT